MNSHITTAFADARESAAIITLFSITGIISM